MKVLRLWAIREGQARKWFNSMALRFHDLSSPKTIEKGYGTSQHQRTGPKKTNISYRSPTSEAEGGLSPSGSF
jgi:hypothetical protein